MTSAAAPHHRPHHEATGAEVLTTMNTFHWLLVLGFPANVAAAQAMPELFTEAEPRATEAEACILAERLKADRSQAA